MNGDITYAAPRQFQRAGELRSSECSSSSSRNICTRRSKSNSH